MCAMQVRRRRWFGLVLGLALATGFLGGCAGEPAPEVPGSEEGRPDPVLVQGRDLWQANCVRCHGGAGGGGAGPALRGPWPDDRQPDAPTMLTVVRDGRGAMPRFGDALSDQEIEAIVRYIREVL